MFELLLKLILSHLAGDFLLQPNSWVEGKNKYGYLSRHLYWHIGIHLCILLLVFQFDLIYWKTICIVIGSHFLIDILKISLTKRINPIPLFFTDQFLHISVIIGITSYHFPSQIDVSWLLFNNNTLLLFIATLILTHVASVIIKLLMSKWKIHGDQPNNEAGRYIGMLERILVFIFIVIDSWEGVGFLLAAKSAFRFGDLTTAKDQRLTEYVLIGTLLSFCLSIGTALGYKELLAIL